MTDSSTNTVSIAFDSTPLGIEDLEKIAIELRGWILDMITVAQSGHPGGSLSAIDILITLFFHEMKNGEKNALMSSERDRFILSKGHAVPALYAVFAKKGWIPVDELKTLRQMGSRLQGHPDRVRLPIVEASTGSLGQGLSIAQGMAMGFKKQKQKARVFCLLGDGESQEGQIWEAALSAPKFELSNLYAILDYNRGQIDGFVHEVMPIEPIADKWKSFGWKVFEVDGHCIASMVELFKKIHDFQSEDQKHPIFIIAHTIKGKGVSFMENNMAWHGTAPTAEETRRAKNELLQHRK